MVQAERDENLVAGDQRKSCSFPEGFAKLTFLNKIVSMIILTVFMMVTRPD
jgi:hypothetical protein